MLRHLVSFALAWMLAAAATPARAAVMVPPNGDRPKDFTLVKKDGVYHLFYIRHNDFLPPFATEIDFGHATSPDLYHWTNLPTVMSINPQGWDNGHVWAPHVVQWNGLWWMFYTGISDLPGFRGTQRMGAAVSSDLMTWNRIGAQPVWSPDLAPSWAWWAPNNGLMACRDPFVMPDPNAPGQWLMYYTATPASDSVATLVAVARSKGDPTVWADEKPLWITHRSLSFNQITESPHLFQHNGRWFLFITANSGQPLTFFVSSDPLGDPAAWTYRGRLRNMLGFDTANWFASEDLRDGDQDVFAFVSSDRVEFHTIVWGTGDNFTLAEPLFFHVTSMSWSKPAVNEFQYVALRIKTANGFAFHPPFVAWMKGAGDADVPVSMASLGIPDMPDLTHDSTVVAWFARRSSSLPANQPMRLRIATPDGNATSDWLTIRPGAIDPPPFAGPGGTAPAMPGEPETPEPSPDPPPLPEDSLVAHAHAGAGGPAGAGAPAAAATPVAGSLRVLLGSPLGGAPAVVFELAQPMNARIDVFDVQGRKRITLADGTFAAGAHALAWDRRDASGASVARGLYFVRLTTPAGVATTRFVLDR